MNICSYKKIGIVFDPHFLFYKKLSGKFSISAINRQCGITDGCFLYRSGSHKIWFLPQNIGNKIIF